MVLVSAANTGIQGHRVNKGHSVYLLTVVINASSIGLRCHRHLTVGERMDNNIISRESAI